jgi:hypothetical protein
MITLRLFDPVLIPFCHRECALSSVKRNNYCRTCMIIVSAHIITYVNTTLFVSLHAVKLSVEYVSRNKPFRRLRSEVPFDYNLCGNVWRLLDFKYGSVINFLAAGTAGTLWLNIRM